MRCGWCWGCVRGVSLLGECVFLPSSCFHSVLSASALSSERRSKGIERHAWCARTAFLVEAKRDVSSPPASATRPPTPRPTANHPHSDPQVHDRLVHVLHPHGTDAPRRVLVCVPSLPFLPSFAHAPATATVLMNGTGAFSSSSSPASAIHPPCAFLELMAQIC